MNRKIALAALPLLAVLGVGIPTATATAAGSGTDDILDRICLSTDLSQINDLLDGDKGLSDLLGIKDSNGGLLVNVGDVLKLGENLTADDVHKKLKCDQRHKKSRKHHDSGSDSSTVVENHTRVIVRERIVHDRVRAVPRGAADTGG